MWIYKESNTIMNDLQILEQAIKLYDYYCKGCKKRQRVCGLLKARNINCFRNELRDLFVDHVETGEKYVECSHNGVLYKKMFLLKGLEDEDE